MVQAIVARINDVDGGGTLIDYSDLDNVLGYDVDGEGEPTGSQTGKNDVSDVLKATNVGPNTSIRIDVVPIGETGASPNLTKGELVGLGADEDQDWTITTAATGESTNANGSVLQTFGTSVVRPATASVAGTAPLANATAGTRKLLVMDEAPGAGGTVVVTYTDHAGSSATATFAAANDYLWLLAVGQGWGEIEDGIA